MLISGKLFTNSINNYSKSDHDVVKDLILDKDCLLNLNKILINIEARFDSYSSFVNYYIEKILITKPWYRYVFILYIILKLTNFGKNFSLLITHITTYHASNPLLLLLVYDFFIFDLENFDSNYIIAKRTLPAQPIKKEIRKGAKLNKEYDYYLLTSSAPILSKTDPFINIKNIKASKKPQRDTLSQLQTFSTNKIFNTNYKSNYFKIINNTKITIHFYNNKTYMSIDDITHIPNSIKKNLYEIPIDEKTSEEQKLSYKTAYVKELLYEIFNLLKVKDFLDMKIYNELLTQDINRTSVVNDINPDNYNPIYDIFAQNTDIINITNPKIKILYKTLADILINEKKPEDSFSNLKVYNDDNGFSFTDIIQNNYKNLTNILTKQQVDLTNYDELKYVGRLLARKIEVSETSTSIYNDIIKIINNNKIEPDVPIPLNLLFHLSDVYFIILKNINILFTDCLSSSLYKSVNTITNTDIVNIYNNNKKIFNEYYLNADTTIYLFDDLKERHF